MINDVSSDVTWVTVAYIPLVRKLTETAADDRSRLRRCGILQRSLFACMRTAIAASHVGVETLVGDQMLTAFPRVLLYVCDKPEERSALCLRAGNCQRPCTTCDVRVEVCGSATALTARERNVVEIYERQLEVSFLRQHNIERQRMETLQADHILTGFVPALAGTAGLSTPPYILHKMIGFDALHVRFLDMFTRVWEESCVVREGIEGGTPDQCKGGLRAGCGTHHPQCIMYCRCSSLSLAFPFA